MNGRQGRINDEDRREWVDNDVGLHNACQYGMRWERISKREWIKRNRGVIDSVINERLGRGKDRQPEHVYYGGKY